VAVKIVKEKKVPEHYSSSAICCNGFGGSGAAGCKNNLN